MSTMKNALVELPAQIAEFVTRLVQLDAEVAGRHYVLVSSSIRSQIESSKARAIRYRM